MSIVEFLRYGIAAALVATFLWAAIDDVANRRIPNASVLTAISLYVVWAVITQGHDLVSGLEAGGIALAVGYAFWSFKLVGAGDAKLFAAGALFVGLGGLLLYALATALSGGLLAALSLVSRPRRAAVMWTLRGEGNFGRGIPYGAAIACGAIVAFWTKLFPALHHWPLG
jgi:prepilin peptidase CpaA